MKLVTRFHHDDVRLLHREPYLRGFFNIDKLTLSHRLFQGTWSEPIERYLTGRRQVVAVLPYDPQTQNILLIEQFRVGPYGAGDCPWVYECIAGLINEDDDPIAAAHREGEEEAGLPFKKLIPVQTLFSSPGTSSARLHLYVACVDLAHYQPGIFGCAHEHENILSHIVSLEDAFQALDAGAIKSASTYTLLLWLRYRLHVDATCFE